jgi:maltose alpha-D-glucosyltransferase/alpha-amylase
MWVRDFTTSLLTFIARGRHVIGFFGDLMASPTRAFRPLLRSTSGLQPVPLKAEQSNTSVVYGEQLILKLYRRMAEGVNPDLEIGRYLTGRHFPNIAPVAGAVEYRRKQGEPMTLAVVQSFIPAQGDAWRYTLDTVGRYFIDVLTRQTEVGSAPIPQKPLLALLAGDVPSPAKELIGFYLETVRLLGQRTGELHVALAQDTGNPDFSPEPFTDLYRRGLYQDMLTQVTQTFQLLRQRLNHLPDAIQEAAQGVLHVQTEVRQRFQALRDRRMTAKRIRCHGDYHLGQVLYTGKDFMIIDFEGEPTRPLSVWQMKRSPLRDVAGMLRSFHYAAYTALLDQTARVRPEDLPFLESWAQSWTIWVSVAFLQTYLSVTDQDGFLPQDSDELQILLEAYLLEKALYELGYELNHRPAWVGIPLQGIMHVLALER